MIEKKKVFSERSLSLSWFDALRFPPEFTLCIDFRVPRKTGSTRVLQRPERGKRLRRDVLTWKSMYEKDLKDCWGSNRWGPFFHKIGVMKVFYWFWITLTFRPWRLTGTVTPITLPDSYPNQTWYRSGNLRPTLTKGFHFHFIIMVIRPLIYDPYNPTYHHGVFYTDEFGHLYRNKSFPRGLLH